MSRYRGPPDDRGIPQRWDRDRFERFSRGGPPPRSADDDDFQFTYTERDRPGRQEITIAERSRSRGPARGGYEERDTRYVEEDRYTSSRPRRRTDRELFGDVDPRELADLALAPVPRKSATREEIEIEIERRERERDRGPPPPRPGALLRRQSSLDSFDRRPRRYEWAETIYPPNMEVAVPVPRAREGWSDVRIREYDDREGEYYETEVRRRRSHRDRPPRSETSGRSSVVEETKTTVSKRESSASSSSTTTVQETVKEEVRETASTRTNVGSASRAQSVHESVHESIHESAGGESVHESIHESINQSGGPGSVHESIHESIEESVRQERKFKKGKTRMPKRLVRREAIMDLGYPFDEDEHFFILRIALEKEQIDEVISISETYRDGEKKKIYRFDERFEENVGGKEEIERTEWINPPTVVGRRARSPDVSSSVSQQQLSPVSPSSRSRRRHRSHSRRESGSRHYEERVVEDRRGPPPPPPGAPELYGAKVLFEEREYPSGGEIVLAQRHHDRTDKDVRAEIRALEAEQRALRSERAWNDRTDLELRLRGRPEDELDIVEYREVTPRGMEVYERDRGPPRNVIRVEKDRKERTKERIFAAAMATLS